MQVPSPLDSHLRPRSPALRVLLDPVGHHDHEEADRRNSTDQFEAAAFWPSRVRAARRRLTWPACQSDPPPPLARHVAPIPMPLSETVRVLAALSASISMCRSEVSTSRSLSAAPQSAACLAHRSAFEINSRRNASLLSRPRDIKSQQLPACLKPNCSTWAFMIPSTIMTRIYELRSGAELGAWLGRIASKLDRGRDRVRRRHE